MPNYALIATLLKSWSLLCSITVLALSATLIARYEKNVRPYAFAPPSGFAAGSAVIAVSAFDTLYLGAMFLTMWLRPTSAFLHMTTDVFGLLVVSFWNLGTMFGYNDAAALRLCGTVDFGGAGMFCALGRATQALGWILALSILAVVLLEAVVILRHYGTKREPARISFTQFINSNRHSRV